MRAIWQDIEEFRSATDAKGKRIAAAKTTRDVGIFWLDLEVGTEVFGASDQDVDEKKLIDAIAGFVEDSGGSVPSFSTSDGVGANGEILKMLLPILLKILSDRFLSQND